MFLENLDALLKERGINRNILSKVSGIPYTTIIGWYKKGWNSVSLASLKKLSAYFEISIDTLVGNKIGEEDRLSQKESTLIKKYRCLDEHGKKTIDIFLSSELNRPYSDNVVKIRHVAEPDGDTYGV